MVETHYRWDFIGLSTDSKPTPATSEKVVDGSTYYTSDDSKLYVWYKDQWYEKEGTGGGTTYTAGDNITIEDGVISATDTTYSNFTGTDGTAAGAAGLVPAPAVADAGKFLKADGTWGEAGGGGSGIIELTSADYDYPADNPYHVALWKLKPGVYYCKQSVSCIPYTGASGVAGGTFIVSKTDDENVGIVYFNPGNSYQLNWVTTTVSTGARFQLLKSTFDLFNGLTSTSTSQALTAKQGYVLKGLIDALDARVTALEGN